MDSTIKFTDRFWFSWLIIIGFWTLIAMLETFQIYLRFLPDEYDIFVEGQKISWFQWALRNVPGWYILAFSTPAIFKLGKLYSFEDERNKLTTFLIHLSISFIFAVLYLALESLLARLITGVPINFELFWGTYTNRLKVAFHLIVTSYWAILGAGYAINFYSKYHERKTQAAKFELRSSKLETQLVKAQLDSLKMQLHPHFLFNTLHTISALIQDNPKIARDMIADLSELLRFTLDAVERQTVTLKKEIEITKLYLDIEQLRFKEKLKVDFHISAEDLAASVPSFILQPLVENAIKHGITGKKETAKIEIKASRINDDLEILVADNGKGFFEQQVEKVSKGIGLNNTKSRLEQLYGSKHKLIIENSKEGGGVIRIVIPYVKEKVFDDN